ncbi:MAG: site-specific DNA-methyltransferase [Litorimonas sp.]
MLAANTPISKTLRPDRDESVDFDMTKNLFIEGDNLDALKLLQDSYLGKVKMIYIDPPYNTGKDFIYKDNFTQDKAEYLEGSGQVDEDGGRLVANTESNGRFHSDWLSMMYPRLKLARNLLRDDGVIFISIDENEISSLIKICDLVFGGAQFVFQATLLCNPKGRSQDKYIANCHEYIVCYSKGEIEKGSLDIARSDEEIAKSYPLSDGGDRYRELELRNTHREFGRHNRPNLFYPFYIKECGECSLERSDESIEVLPLWNDGFEGCWTWGREKSATEAELLVARKVNENWKIYRKSYAINSDGEAVKKVKSIWTDKSFHTEKGQARFNELFASKEKLFQSPKSVSLLERLIEMGADSGDILMDFFAGSGSFFDATFSQSLLGKMDSLKCIGVQLDAISDKESNAFQAGYKTIADLSKERIRRAGAKILEDNPDQVGKLDVGFRVLKIDSSNMLDVHDTSDTLSQKDLLGQVAHIRSDRAAEDLLFQVMLNRGLELSQSIECDDATGQALYRVGGDNLAACFAHPGEGGAVTTETVKAMAAGRPLYAVFRDDGFASDADKINAAQLFEQLTDDHTRMLVI